MQDLVACYDQNLSWDVCMRHVLGARARNYAHVT